MAATGQGQGLQEGTTFQGELAKLKNKIDNLRNTTAARDTQGKLIAIKGKLTELLGNLQQMVATIPGGRAGMEQLNQIITEINKLLPTEETANTGDDQGPGRRGRVLPRAVGGYNPKRKYRKSKTLKNVKTPRKQLKREKKSKRRQRK